MANEPHDPNININKDAANSFQQMHLKHKFMQGG